MSLNIHAEHEIAWIDSTTSRSYRLLFGKDDGMGSFEVLLGESEAPPTNTQLRDLHSTRLNKRNADLVVALKFGDSVWLFGPEKDRSGITLKAESAARALQTCLDEPDSLSAYKRYVTILDAHGTTDMPGVRNRGLFANHHLRENVPKRRDWALMTEAARPLVRLRHRELIAQLGYSVSDEVSDALVLCDSNDDQRAIAVLLNSDENFESSSSRFPSSPVATGLGVAQRLGAPWLIVLRNEQIRLYPGRDGVGVGQKGQVETYLELDLAMLDDDHLGLLPLIFSADALSQGGSTELLLTESAKYAADLGDRLRNRVYEKVVPSISTAIAEQFLEQGQELDSAGLQKAYSVTLKILFRLLFQAYAEDRGLLPAGRNERYDANSLKTIAQRDIDTPVDQFSNAATIWNDLIQVWDAIDQGSPLWQVPAYNGGLFGSDPIAHPEGHLIRSLRIPDSILGPALQGLLIDFTDEGVQGPVDFRSLSVREFGTIYEGLLESSLSLAEVDLTIDNSGSWVPANVGDRIEAQAGRPYFHSSSGERKATGSYFTKSFVVDHLVSQAIDPVVGRHLEKIRGYISDGDSARAYLEFFDFRVADLAMGSGHFLVAAVDRIEMHMRAFLSDRDTQIPGVVDELNRLRNSAISALGKDVAAVEEIEDASLLRRQIARRCIYGVDINPLAVELSRLALWIHTFVPGLPMSSLDHGLACANSITGIGSVNEALDLLIPPSEAGSVSFFDDEIKQALSESRQLLMGVADSFEADVAEIRDATAKAMKAREIAAPIKLVFDAALAVRVGIARASHAFDMDSLIEIGRSPKVQEFVSRIEPAHFPYLFPEVFVRENPGFDVLLGNPPWEKLHVDEQRWWGILIPGLRSMRPNEKRKKLDQFQAARPDLMAHYERDVEDTKSIANVILKGPFPGVGAAHLDLFTVFAWRNYQLLRDTGRAGVVLPRNALVGSALTEWRREIFKKASFENICILSNLREWVFEGVHQQYTVALVVIEAISTGSIRMSGPFFSLDEFEAGNAKTVNVDGHDLENWSQALAVPSLRGQIEVEILNSMFMKGKFSNPIEGKFEFRPYAELNAASDKSVFQFEKPDSEIAIEVYGGASFNIWEPAAGPPYAYGVGERFRAEMMRRLEGALDRARNAEAREVGLGRERSAYFGVEFTEGELPLDKARIAYRQITNQTNTRTTIACLVPPGTATVHSAPTLVRRLGDAKDEAFLLGVLCSVPFDWAARKWVEINLTMEILGQLPVPATMAKTKIGLEISNLAGRLAAADSRYESWANEVGVECGTVSSVDEKNEIVARIDALVAIAFGLTQEQVIWIYSNFHRGWDFQERLDEVLTHFNQLDGADGG